MFIINCESSGIRGDRDAGFWDSWFGTMERSNGDRAVLKRNGTDGTGERNPCFFGSGRDFRGLTGTKGCHRERKPCIRRFV